MQDNRPSRTAGSGQEHKSAQPAAVAFARYVYELVDFVAGGLEAVRGSTPDSPMLLAG